LAGAKNERPSANRLRVRSKGGRCVRGGKDRLHESVQGYVATDACQYARIPYRGPAILAEQQFRDQFVLPATRAQQPVV
jgi:hypothetical protein